MVKDAEANADADKERRETIDVKNSLDSVIYSTEKTLKENKDKLKEEDVKEAEEVVEEAKKHLEGRCSYHERASRKKSTKLRTNWPSPCTPNPRKKVVKHHLMVKTDAGP